MDEKQIEKIVKKAIGEAVKEKLLERLTTILASDNAIKKLRALIEEIITKYPGEIDLTDKKGTFEYLDVKLYNDFRTEYAYKLCDNIMNKISQREWEEVTDDFHVIYDKWWKTNFSKILKESFNKYQVKFEKSIRVNVIELINRIGLDADKAVDRAIEDLTQYEVDLSDIDKHEVLDKISDRVEQYSDVQEPLTSSEARALDDYLWKLFKKRS